jgi:hypothetical protein
VMFVSMAALAIFGAAEGQGVAQAPASAVKQPEVIITGDRAQFANRITAYVNELTDFDYGDANRGLARWQDKVCPLVTGMPRDMAEYILLRVSEIARDAGVPLAGEHCTSRNLFIIVTKHPEAYLRDLQKLHGSDVFGGAAPMLINDFISTPLPVRTWYDTVELSPEGMPLSAQSFPGVSSTATHYSAANTIVIDPVHPMMNDYPLTNGWSQASHLVLNVVWAIKRDYVIVDPTKFQGVKLGQLADYIAMAGLAQVKLNPRLADAPTILTLFDKPPQQSAMGVTEWDQSFMKSFYSTEQKSVIQRSTIARDMVSRMAH